MDVSLIEQYMVQRANWCALWEKSKHTPARWDALRKIYSEFAPSLSDGQRHSPYFIDWDGCLTPIEWDMWESIRILGLPFFPQYPVGRFFVDFADPLRRIAIECDGKAFHDKENDAKRDAELAGLGWRVWRFTGAECWRGEDREDSAHQKLMYLAREYRGFHGED